MNSIIISGTSSSFQTGATCLFNTVSRWSSVLALSASLSLAGCGGSEESPMVTLERARISMQREEFAEAIPLLDKAILALPGDSEARYQRGVAMETLGALEKALEDYDECLKISPKRTDAMNNRAVVLAKLERFEEAAAQFSQLVDLNPEESLGYRNRALCNVDMKSYDTALADYARALEINPKDPANWYQRAAVYQLQERWDAAEQDFSKAIELDPELARAYMNRGIVRYQQGDSANGALDLKKAQELDDSIVVPQIPSYTAENAWITTRAFAETDLQARGFSNVQLIREFPAQLCAEYSAVLDEQAFSVVVAASRTSEIQIPVEVMAGTGASADRPEFVPRRDLLVLEPATDSAAPSVVRFQKDWKPADSEGRPVILAFPLK